MQNPKRPARRPRVVLVLLLSSLGVSTCSPPAVQTPPASAPASVIRQDGIRWMDRSAEHDAMFLQTYRQATEAVERASAVRPAGSWAVILDADETVINNVVYQIERDRAGLGFTAESWRAWVARREATPLPGARAFMDRVRSLGGKIAIVTNRLGSECDDTAAVFVAHRLPYDAMLCRPDGTPSDKNPRFRQVAEGRSAASSTPIEVLLYVGDNILDFPDLSQAAKAQGEAAFALFGTRYFMLPNAMYGSWQTTAD